MIFPATTSRFSVVVTLGYWVSVCDAFYKPRGFVCL